MSIRHDSSRYARFGAPSAETSIARYRNQPGPRRPRIDPAILAKASEAGAARFREVAERAKADYLAGGGSLPRWLMGIVPEFGVAMARANHESCLAREASIREQSANAK